MVSAITRSAKARPSASEARLDADLRLLPICEAIAPTPANAAAVTARSAPIQAAPLTLIDAAATATAVTTARTATSIPTPAMAAP